jgi:hypothetical protein
VKEGRVRQDYFEARQEGDDVKRTLMFAMTRTGKISVPVE